MLDKLQALEKAKLKQAIDGDHGALSWLLSFHHRQLHSLVSTQLGTDLKTVVDADDVVQMVHMEVAKRIGDFTPGDEADCFFRWLATIARRRVVDAGRKARAVKRGQNHTRPITAVTGDTSKVMLLEQLQEHTDTPSRVLASREALLALDEAIADLPEDHQRVVRMFHLEQQPIEKVAHELGRSEAATYKLSQRSLKMLKTLLGQRSKFL